MPSVGDEVMLKSRIQIIVPPEDNSNNKTPFSCLCAIGGLRAKFVGPFVRPSSVRSPAAASCPGKSSQHRAYYITMLWHRDNPSPSPRSCRGVTSKQSDMHEINLRPWYGIFQLSSLDAGQGLFGRACVAIWCIGGNPSAGLYDN